MTQRRTKRVKARTTKTLKLKKETLRDLDPKGTIKGGWMDDGCRKTRAGSGCSW